MNFLFSVAVILVMILLVIIGVSVLNLSFLFGVIIPYLAIVTFLTGFVYRIFSWAKSPVPFNITTTCGQQKSLPHIKNSSLENPHNSWAVVKRMALEVLCFRSLFRNTKAELTKDQKLIYSGNKWLWLGAIVFHYSFLIVFIRHLRFFAEPVPQWILGVQALDGFFQFGSPVIYITSFAIIGALGFLLLRRLFDPKLRYISLAADYFPLFLILGIATSGICIRHFARTDIVSVKALAMSLLNFSPIVAENLGVVFFIHLFFISVLFAYFPFSKLMHLGGVFLSPTRNLTGNSRAKRHINPWNPDVNAHSYAEWEEEFHDVIKDSGLPMDKE